MYTMMMMMMHWLLWIRGRVVVSVLPAAAGVAMYFYRTTFWFYRESQRGFVYILVHYFYGR